MQSILGSAAVAMRGLAIVAMLTWTTPARAEELVAPFGKPVTCLFTSFRGNGEDGLHLAYSRGGYRWTALKNDQSFLKPLVGSKLMRDPSLVQAPDGTFHMVWTTGWWDKGFGYAFSKDLIHWSEQKYIPVNENVPGAKNTWAPDLFYDRASRTYYVIYATTIPGRFSETDKDGDHNHRLYYVSTKDFQTFTDPKLLYNPGFNCIDGTLIHADGKYVLIFKDERLSKKHIRLATAEHPAGPYSEPSDPIPGNWIEGPSAVKVAGDWIIYFDHYANPQYYGAVKSTDLKTWQPITDRLSFPQGVRHGTAISVSESVLEKLLAN